MNNIEIQIYSIANQTNIFIDTINYKLIINSKEKNITKEQIEELIRIIRTWKPLYDEINNQIDSEKFTINVNTNEGTETIVGAGGYPENYSSFKDWIGEFYE